MQISKGPGCNLSGFESVYPPGNITACWGCKERAMRTLQSSIFGNTYKNTHSPSEKKPDEVLDMLLTPLVPLYWASEWVARHVLGLDSSESIFAIMVVMMAIMIALCIILFGMLLAITA
jgi:hypothetical protein